MYYEEDRVPYDQPDEPIADKEQLLIEENEEEAIV